MAQKTLLQVVREDLDYLQSVAFLREVDDRDLRRLSTILRRFVVEGDLGSAWRESGKTGEPSIATYSFGPTTVTTLINYSKSLATAGIAARKGNAGGGVNNPDIVLEELSLSAYREAPCLISEARPISRRVLINYMANKLGGAHFDPSRSDKEPLYSVLDRSVGKATILGLDGVFFEFLAIAQALINSNDIKGLRQL